MHNQGKQVCFLPDGRGDFGDRSIKSWNLERNMLQPSYLMFFFWPGAHEGEVIISYQSSQSPVGARGTKQLSHASAQGGCSAFEY